ncbi:hypothetical protein ACVI3U_001632 [Sinorhizobium medicae]
MKKEDQADTDLGCDGEPVRRCAVDRQDRGESDREQQQDGESIWEIAAHVGSSSKRMLAEKAHCEAGCKK